MEIEMQRLKLLKQLKITIKNKICVKYLLLNCNHHYDLNYVNIYNEIKSTKTMEIPLLGLEPSTILFIW